MTMSPRFAAPEPKQDRSRLTRLRILEATVDSLMTHGWEGTTVSQVAADANISRGALQHHFRTREDLTLAALDHMFELRAAELRDLDIPPVTGEARVRAATQAACDLFNGSLFRAALQVWAAAAVDETLRARVSPLERKFGRGIHDRFVILLGVDDSDPAVRSLVQATLDLIRGLALADTLSDDSRRRIAVLNAWIPPLSRALTATE